MKQTLIRLGKEHCVTLSDTAVKRLAQQPGFNCALISMSSPQQLLLDKGNALLVMGTPLPAITKLPLNWQEAAKIFPEHEGVFAAFFWDAQAQKLVVCTDFLGLQPLYCKIEKAEIVFSDKTSAFTGEPNLMGWGAFLALGYTLGQDTLTKGVERLASAAVIIIDANTLDVQQHTYWAFDYQRPPASTQETFAALEASFNSALLAKSDMEHTILMSGGYDSRLMAYLLKKKHAQFKATIVSHYDENLDADAQYAMLVTNHLNIPHQLKVPDRDFFSSNEYLAYLEASDAEIPSLYLFITQVFQFVDSPVVWDGLIPGFTLKASKKDFAEYKNKNVKSYDHDIWRNAERVFGLQLAQKMWLAFEQRWHQEIANFPDNGNGVALFNLAHRARNRVGINPFKVYQQNAAVLMPGLSKDFIQAAMSIDYAKKKNHKLYKDIFARYFPTALQFPVAHGSTVELLHCKTLSSRLFYFAIKLSNKLKQYPRLNKLLMLEPQKGFSDSQFVYNTTGLMGFDNRFIDASFVSQLQQGHQVPEQALRILFYWRVWQGLREKPLDSHFK